MNMSKHSGERSIIQPVSKVSSHCSIFCSTDPNFPQIGGEDFSLCGGLRLSRFINPCWILADLDMVQPPCNKMLVRKAFSTHSIAYS